MSAYLVECLLLCGPLLAPCTPTRAPGRAAQEGIWITAQELEALPMEGEAWLALAGAAARPLSVPNLGGRDDNTDVLCLAKALVFARTGDAAYRAEVLRTLREVVGTERNGDILSLGRNLPGYVIAADLIHLPPTFERRFQVWLRRLLRAELEGTTLRRVHERRPNNWGTHAGAARAVVARYLGDDEELERVAQVFRGWLGERGAYDAFDFGDLDWQASPGLPVGINPPGASRDGHSLDGVLGDDQRRAGAFTWPPPKENYVYEALQGALVQAVVLGRAGYDVWEWGDRALLRAFRWLDDVADYPAEGDDTWQPHVINHFYRTELRSQFPSRPGKNMGWTDWVFPRKERAGILTSPR